MKSLENKVAVVTGGNSGIGYASAKELKENGAEVIITGRSAEKVAAAARELGVKGIVADVGDIAQIESLVREIKESHGQIDILFVNAGVMAFEAVGQISEKGFHYQMDINFKGAVFTIEKFLPVLKEGASVINLSSIAAYTGTPNIAIYSASKAALVSYTKTAAIELANRRIRVNVINPGPTDTAIFSKLGFPEGQEGPIKELAQQGIPLKRLGTPEEVAKLVKYLASEASSFITGAEFNIDGGMAIKS